MAYGETGSSGGHLVKKRYPVRGILWGIPLGLGLAIVLVVSTVISLELMQIAVVVVLGIAAGVVWSLYGPARAAKGIAPASLRPQDPPAPLDTVDEGVNEEVDVGEAEQEIDDDPPG